jgi:hypothetical protein
MKIMFILSPLPSFILTEKLNPDKSRQMGLFDLAGVKKFLYYLVDFF